MKLETKVWLVIFAVAGLYLAARAATTGVGLGYSETVDGITQPATYTQAQLGFAETSWSQTAGIWTAAFMTLAVLSFLYRDNVVYKLSESVFIGVSAAYWMIVSFWTVLVPNLMGKLLPRLTQSWAMPGLSPVPDENWAINIVPLVLGAMVFPASAAQLAASPLAGLAAWLLAASAGNRAAIQTEVLSMRDMVQFSVMSVGAAQVKFAASLVSPAPL